MLVVYHDVHVFVLAEFGISSITFDVYKLTMVHILKRDNWMRCLNNIF